MTSTIGSEFETVLNIADFAILEVHRKGLIWLQHIGRKERSSHELAFVPVHVILLSRSPHSAPELWGPNGRQTFPLSS